MLFSYVEGAHERTSLSILPGTPMCRGRPPVSKSYTMIKPKVITSTNTTMKDH